MPYRCDILRNTQNGDWKYKPQSWPVTDTDIRKNIRLYRKLSGSFTEVAVN